MAKSDEPSPTAAGIEEMVAAARVGAPCGFVRTPAGGFIPEDQFRQMVTPLRPPAGPPFIERERRRDLRWIKADVSAELFSSDPTARRARMLAKRLEIVAERIEDSETPADDRARLLADVNRACSAFANVEDATKKRLELLEHIEVCAIGGGPASEVIRGFSREHPEEAALLAGHEEELQALLDVWLPKRGAPAGPRKLRGERENKWARFAKILRTAKIPRPTSESTLQREWEQHRPHWLVSMRKQRGRAG